MAVVNRREWIVGQAVLNLNVASAADTKRFCHSAMEHSAMMQPTK
jgi:hypothetical protein